MDLTVAELETAIADIPESNLEELHSALESILVTVRKRRAKKYIAEDARVKFDRGIYTIELGDLELKGQVAQYSPDFNKKNIVCVWGARCRKQQECEYYHPEFGSARVLRYGDSPLIKKFLALPPAALGSFFRSNPEMKREIINFKDRIVDGLIRLLWLVSEGIKI